MQRQLEDCRKLAAERGWTVAEEYIDNHISAFKGKDRPQYARECSRISRRVGVMLCWPTIRTA